MQLVDLSSNTVVDSTSRVGNGSYSFTWYDNTHTMKVIAYESSTYKGTSVAQTADAGTFDISLSSSGGPTYYAYS